MACEDDDTMKLLQIFPNEVWKMILESVNNSKDYQSISSTSPHLYNLLLSRASQVLFPEVISILAHRTHEHWLPWMHTRQVCRAWRDGVNQKLPNKRKFAAAFNTAEDFEKFENHFDPTHLDVNANPFHNRKIHLAIGFINVTSTVKRDCVTSVRFLKKYGTHVWHCIVEQWVDYEVLEPEGFYNYWLPRFLELMPNLRSFKIVRCLGRPCRELIQLQNWEPRIDVNFSHLPHLEYLSLNSLPTLFVKYLIEKNPQLHRLDAWENCDAILLNLSNLMKLSVLLRQKRKFGEFLAAQFMTSVEDLRLDTRMLKVVSLIQIFKLVKTHFGQTLVKLDLLLPAPLIQDISFNVTLPRLKELRLELKSPEPLYFLQQFKDTLEKLELTLTQPLPSGYREGDKRTRGAKRAAEGDLAEFYMFWNLPKYSKIWLLLPKLRYLQTETRFPDGKDTLQCAWRHWSIGTGRSWISEACLA